MAWYRADAADLNEITVVSNKNWSSGSNNKFAIVDMSLDQRGNPCYPKMKVMKY